MADANEKTTESIELAVRELGALIDAHYVNDGKPKVNFLNSLTAAGEFGRKSDLHARIHNRENFALSALLWHPTQYAGKTWPYTHPFIGIPKPDVLGDKDPLRFLWDEEAHVHYRARANQCSDLLLQAKYADMAARTGSTSRESAQQAVAAALKAFPVVLATKDQYHAANVLLQGLETAVRFKLEAEMANVVKAIQDKIDETLETGQRIATDLIYGTAKLTAKQDKKRTLLRYAEIADRCEKHAVQISLLNKEERRKQVFGSPFGVALGMAKLTKDKTRIARVGRLHAKTLLDFARERNAERETPLNVRHWLFETMKVLDGLEGNADLRADCKRDIQNIGERLDEGLTEHTFEIDLGADGMEQLKTQRSNVVQEVDKWPELAALLVVGHIITQEQSEAQPKSVFDGLVAVMRQDGRRATFSSNSDWEHVASTNIGLALQFMWRFVFSGALRELYDAGHVTHEVLLRPFVTKLFPFETFTDDFQLLASAADSFLRGDSIAAAQQWTLLVERILRNVIKILGGSTTAVRPNSQDDRESVFDSAVAELRRVLELHRVEKRHSDRICNLLMFLFSWPKAGWNWRNKVAHGLMQAEQLDNRMAFYAYIACVSLVVFLKVNESQAESTAPPNQPKAP